MLEIWGNNGPRCFIFAEIVVFTKQLLTTNMLYSFSGDERLNALDIGLATKAIYIARRPIEG